MGSQYDQFFHPVGHSLPLGGDFFLHAECPAQGLQAIRVSFQTFGITRIKFSLHRGISNVMEDLSSFKTHDSRAILKESPLNVHHLKYFRQCISLAIDSRIGPNCLELLSTLGK